MTIIGWEQGSSSPSAAATCSALSFTDIQTRVMNALRIPTTNTTEATKVGHIINDVYRELYAMHDWWWLIKRDSFNTVAPYSTGTIALTQSSTSATLSSASSISRSGSKLIVASETTDSGAVWRIDSHTASATAVTLDGPGYSGATNATASFSIRHDEYSFDCDVGKPLRLQRFGYSHPCQPISPSEMMQLKAYDTSTGKPQLWTVEDFSTTGDATTYRRLILHPYPDAIYRLEVIFKRVLNTEVSGSTNFFIPDDYIYILVWGALARAYPIFLNDLQRGTYFQALYDQLLAKMIGAQRERYEDPPKIQPRDAWRGFYRRSSRISAATADLGAHFDRWPSQF